MADCEFLHRYKNKAGELQELCALTGRVCFVDPVVADPRSCTRRAWALDAAVTGTGSGSGEISPKAGQN